MNPVIQAIRKRRSVRSYKPDPVPRDVIEAIIDAGNWAPTGLDQQCWRFAVVEGGLFRQELIEAALPTWKKAFDRWIGSQNDQIRVYLSDLCRGALAGLPNPTRRCYAGGEIWQMGCTGAHPLSSFASAPPPTPPKSARWSART
jgi:nitroreductase